MTDRAVPSLLLAAATFLTGLVWLFHLLPTLMP